MNELMIKIMAIGIVSGLSILLIVGIIQIIRFSRSMDLSEPKNTKKNKEPLDQGDWNW